MIKTEVIKHPLAYLILLTGTILFILSFFVVWPDRTLERVVIGSYSLFYFFWGVGTHLSKRQLNSELVKEYGLVAVLGALLLLMLTF